jgi:hypothetical protein
VVGLVPMRRNCVECQRISTKYCPASPFAPKHGGPFGRSLREIVQRLQGIGCGGTSIVMAKFASTMLLP